VGRVSCLETPVRNYHSSLRKIQKQHISHVPDVSLASVFSPDMALTSIVIKSNDSDKKCADLLMRSRETLDSLTTTNGLSFVISVLNMPKCC
jgi:hypothetical protein